ncbi:uncharacterized protein LY89DRAFT_772092 [Mollisia scopiformis]|uniref:Uncharacterized protein n=1 Tax=Mollisia scopiformis TaxID=149040 RepID=A0A194XHL2_MOLSC|nr:uncharacterized protein LY89DRAFT_772092 [Mollisia scopiformis]KUJ19619.1 hypothetical protein LY89DRAFT_772092 [Mollisia scopiformis]
MADDILVPLANDLVNLINIFSKAATVLPSSKQTFELSQLHDIRKLIHHSLEDLNHKQSLSSDAENQHSVGSVQSEEAPKQLSEAAKVCLENIAAEGHILRDVLIDPVQGMNALIALYIVNSFDEPLLQLLTPHQCAQLLEAISLADVVSELDKQLQVLKATAEEHEQEHDPHLELVKDIKTNLLNALERIRKIAASQSEIQTRSQELLPGKRLDCDDLLALDTCIQNMYTGLQTQDDATQHLVEEQERAVIALKLFLEDKVTRIKERRVLRSSGNPADRSRGLTGWPPATIPTAQLSTILLSRIVAHLIASSSLNHSDAAQSPTLGIDPPIVEAQLQPAAPSEVPSLIDRCDYHGEAKVMDTPNPESVESSHQERSSIQDPIPEKTHPVVPHVKFNVPKHLDKRRDSAISLLSSTGKPEQMEIHEDETLPESDESVCGEDGNLEQENEQYDDEDKMDAAVEKIGDGTIEQLSDEQIAGSERLEQDGTPIEDEIQTSPLVDDASMPNLDTNEDLYSADDHVTPTLRTRSDCNLATDETSSTNVHEVCLHQDSSQQSPREPTTQFLSTHWPQRAWLQTILSMLTPEPTTQSTTPLSPSFPSEALASPPPNPSTSDWYSGYDAWWSFTMRDSSSRDDHADSESTTTSTSEQSWGAGSRSTEADSIDS